MRVRAQSTQATQEHIPMTVLAGKKNVLVSGCVFLAVSDMAVSVLAVSVFAVSNLAVSVDYLRMHVRPYIYIHCFFVWLQ